MSDSFVARSIVSSRCHLFCCRLPRRHLTLLTRHRFEAHHITPTCCSTRVVIRLLSSHSSEENFSYAGSNSSTDISINANHTLLPLMLLKLLCCFRQWQQRWQHQRQDPLDPFFWTVIERSPAHSFIQPFIHSGYYNGDHNSLDDALADADNDDSGHSSSPREGTDVPCRGASYVYYHTGICSCWRS